MLRELARVEGDDDEVDEVEGEGKVGDEFGSANQDYYRGAPVRTKKQTNVSTGLKIKIGERKGENKHQHPPVQHREKPAKPPLRRVPSYALPS